MDEKTAQKGPALDNEPDTEPAGQPESDKDSGKRWRRRWLAAVSYRFIRRAERYLPPGIRSILGLVLCAAGILGFLPILGFWMIPLGIALIATDVPPLRRWFLHWLNKRRRINHGNLCESEDGTEKSSAPSADAQEAAVNSSAAGDRPSAGRGRSLEEGPEKTRGDS